MQNKIIYQEWLTNLDWFVFFTILVITYLVVWAGQKWQKQQQQQQQQQGEGQKSNSYLELFLMSRRLTLPLFVGTLVAAWYGGIIGVTQIAFEKGIYTFITQGLFWYITYLIFAFFLVKRISKYQAVTIADLVGKIYGKRAQKLSALIYFFTLLPIAYLIGVAVFLQLFIPLFSSLWPLMAMGLLIVIPYTIWGGFRAVVFSDLVQCVVMCTAVMMIIPFSIYRFGGIDFLQQSLPPFYFQFTASVGLAGTISWGLISLATLVDPCFYQRVFAATSDKVAKRGIIIATIIWFVFDICTTLGAMYARAVLPEASSAEAYLIYGMQLLPNGLRGFFLAGILATILSTLDAYLFLAGTTLTHDLLNLKHQWWHRLGVLLAGLISIPIALLFDGNIRDVWMFLGSYSTAALMVPILFGQFFSAYVGERDFFIASLAAVFTTTWWKFATDSVIDPIYIGIVTSLFAMGATILYQKIYNNIKKRRVEL